MYTSASVNVGTSIAAVNPMFDFTLYPPAFKVAVGNVYFQNLYNLSAVPDIPLALPYASAGSVTCDANNLSPSACSWGCTLCTAPTDIISCPNNQDWAYTFDDGPSQFTPNLLSWLSNNSIKASFCVIGSEITLNPAILLQEFQAGHHIVAHTWSHHALTSLPNDEVVAELEWSVLAIEQVIGTRPKYFRPPYGDIDNRVRAIAAAMNLTPIIWNYDTNDWKLFTNATAFPPNQIPLNASSFASLWQTKSQGVISLEHDLYNVTASEGSLLGAAVLAAGMNLKTIAQCINDTNPYSGADIAVVSLAAAAATIAPPVVTTTTTISSGQGSSATASSSGNGSTGKATSNSRSIRKTETLAISAVALLFFAFIN